MVKQIHCDDPQLEHQIQELLNLHMGPMDELVDKLEMRVAQTDEGTDEPLYHCRVVVTDPHTGKLAVEERHADISLTVNRALARIVRSLMRRQLNRHAF
ncbi:MAG: hypothetical protein K1566_17205 [Candidatus Thiodiazotropha sp. (ex. Lucinisca nassula)]|uniref:hypothetical protein n=1 Tax=Candidatus Thiodiazotropha endoloripes TaxID=1818881 RepID=UPI00083D86D7|nr:hypothetical protein [Candidatus Thiodiazotropha endoloripes]MBW9257822.1 hypothetical protein [Candidatus Thiodiazotropha sp. (ex. Lucinisca nassula)]MCG7904516.1 hypothetical protein [Candidatus Thiodiazotropha weberae]RLW70342.1 MAG: hypothetical protein B6D71_06780 [gamma proteobacterium symbiont of Stewartia floridana]MBW9260979.1 hypothetical protein [Candidatus Thiodiazotropha sp. (ex. Lucinisca nassula)]MBW9271379.1 hypothetical protein [Candidatus Thiodiazotropha sp. (ex. Lucinisca